MKITVRNKILITNPDDRLVERLEEELTFDNPAYAQIMRYSPYDRTNVPATISLLEVEKGKLAVPRGIDLARIPKKFRVYFRTGTFKDQRHSVPTEFPERLLSLNREQRILLNAFKRAKNQGERPFGTFLLVSSTSTGKTILQASIAKKLGQRTLVLCKTNLIQKAWLDDLKKLFGLERKEIGQIQQKNYRIGAQFTLSSLATLNRRQHLWDEIFSNFGTVILDEVHLLPADGIQRFVSACPCKYLVGATATIKKNDEKKRKIVYNFFGPPVKELEAVQDATETSMPISDVRVVPTNFALEMPREDFDYNFLIDKLIGDDKRNGLIAKNVLKDWKEGHCVLVTTNRVGHAELLAAELEELGIDDVNVLVGSNNSATRYEMLVNMLKEGKVKCTVATDQLIAVGANLPPIDRLHITTPIKDTEKLKQLLGRIRRKFPGKKDAIVTYYHDKGTGYLDGIFRRVASHVFREMKVRRFLNVFMA